VFGSYDLTLALDVVVGRHDLRTGTDGERIGVSEVHVHPDYDDNTFVNDVALLRLEQAATAGSAVTLASEVDADDFAAGEEATVIGWGATLGFPPPNYPDVLREVSIPVVSDADCAAAYGALFQTPEMICAGELGVGGEDACQGDSGGPLFVADGTGFLHVGVVSWGDGCAKAKYPGVYARTATYVDWVESVSGVSPQRCDGLLATVRGTDGDDVLVGTADADVIAAGAGNDLIRARGGDDIICAGTGNDDVRAGAGDDTVYGEGGDDTLDGAGGADTIDGGAGADTVAAGEDDDTVYGRRGDDTVDAGSGADTVRAGPGLDAVDGGAGDDDVRGGTGDDDVRGGTGDDKAKGNGGDDEVRGEGGDDRLSGGSGTDTVIGGGGDDVCRSGETVDCETQRTRARVE
jgi:Ca2+-binding RTX toxin-like protein